MQVMSIKINSKRKLFFGVVIAMILGSLVLGHPMAYEKQLEKNVWAKFGKDHDTSLTEQIR